MSRRIVRPPSQAVNLKCREANGLAAIGSLLPEKRDTVLGDVKCIAT